MKNINEPIEKYRLDKNIMKKGSLSKVGIVGCGSMGQEIAQHISRYGIEVVFIDVNQKRIDEIFVALGNQLDEIINKWGITSGEKRAILQRITGSTDYYDLKDCELVIETINTKKPGTSKEIRKSILNKIESVVSPTAVLTSNTATLMISELSSELKYPERALGVHFISPVSRIKIVEVVRGSRTNDESYDFVRKFARMIEKEVINIHESPGNIHTRMIVPMINEACEILMEGVATVRDIDETMKRATGFQFGPFEMADKLGLDKILKWMDNLYQEYGEYRYKASPIIKRLVRSNHLGRPTEVGFYKYKNGKATAHTITCVELR